MRRVARERFRVYTEDQFLADPAIELHDSPVPRSSGRRRGRLAAAALLIGAIGSVGGVCAAWLLVSQRHARAGRGSPGRRASMTVIAAAIASPRASGIVANGNGVASSSAARRRVVGRRGRSMRRATRGRVGSRGGLRRAQSPPATPPSVPAAGGGLGAAQAGTTGIGRLRAAAASPSTVEPARGSGEFGFER